MIQQIACNAIDTGSLLQQVQLDRDVYSALNLMQSVGIIQQARHITLTKRAVIDTSCLCIGEPQVARILHSAQIS